MIVDPEQPRRDEPEPPDATVVHIRRDQRHAYVDHRRWRDYCLSIVAQAIQNRPQDDEQPNPWKPTPVHARAIARAQSERNHR